MHVPFTSFKSSRGVMSSSHLHLTINKTNEISLAFSKLAENQLSDRISLATSSSFLLSHTQALVTLCERLSLLLLEGDLAALPAQMRNQIAAGRVVITNSPDGVICYIDATPFFAYSTNVGSSCSEWWTQRFAPAFLDRFFAQGDLSSAIAFAMLFGKTVPSSDLADPSEASLLELVRERSRPEEFLGSSNEYLKQISSCTEVIEASAVYVVRGQNLLLTRKPPQNSIIPGVWYLPGGKLQGRESPEECARRELFEETRLHGENYTSLGAILFIDPRDSSRLFRFFQFVSNDSYGEAQAHDDIRSCDWVSIPELTRSQVFDPLWTGLMLGRLIRLI